MLLSPRRATALAGAVLLPLTVSSSTAATAPTSADDHIDHVVAISVDGLNPDAIRELGRRGAPNMVRMLREGVSTLNARTAVESTSTLPNHTSMLTSRRVAADSGGHGVTFNTDRTGNRTVHRAAGRYVASVFDVAHDRGHRTALFTSKDKFALYDRSWDGVRGAADRVGSDDGRDKITRFTYREDESTLARLARDDLRHRPARFTFVHFARTDKEGHRSGYMGAAYLRAMRGVDARIGLLLREIEAQPRLRESTAVILTSDHGGLGHHHSDATKRVNYTVPFVVWGHGITRGNLYSMNPEYTSPGTSRPGYSDPQPIRNAALGNLALDLLDLPAIPGSEINRARDLDVFHP